MDKSSGEKKRLTGVQKSLAVAIGFLIITFITFLFAIRPLVRSKIMSAFSQYGLEVQKLSIRHIGLSKLDLQDIVIEASAKPAIAIATVSLDYSPFRLLKGRVDRVMISGAKIIPENLTNLELRNSPESGPPGFAVNRLQLLSSEIELASADETIFIPLDVELLRQADSHRYKITATGLPFGRPWQCNGIIDAASGDGRFTIEARYLRLQNLLDLFLASAGILVPSPAEATLEVELKQWQLYYADVAANATMFDIVAPPYAARASWRFKCRIPSSLRPEALDVEATLHSLTGPDLEISQPFIVKIAGGSADSLAFHTEGVNLQKPIPATIREIAGIISIGETASEFTGSYAIELPPGILTSIQPSLRADAPVLVTGDLTFPFPPRDSQWTLKGDISQQLAVTGDRFTSSLNQLTIACAIEGNSSRTSSRLRLNTNGIRLSMPDLSLEGRRIRMNATMNTENEGWRASGNVRVEGIDAGIGGQVSIKNLSAVIPLQMSGTEDIVPPKNGKQQNRITQTGNFSADEVDIAGLVLKKLTGELGVGPSIMLADGEAEFAVKELSIKYSATRDVSPGLDTYSLNFEIPTSQLPEATSLGSLHPSLKGIKISGAVSGTGELQGVGDIVTGTGQIQLADFRLEIKESGILLGGIDGIIRFRNLPVMLSEPGQEITVRELDVQGLQFRDGRLVFTSEGPNSILVERGEFRLLGGKVFFGGVRVGTNSKDFSTVLYCDRIDFGRLLNVLVGETIASGDAEINGVIPLKFSGGDILFDEGFLYSSPGIQGSLQIQDASLISGGMVLVEEAVRDFSYEWVRVKLNTRKDRLDMNIVLKGVPAAKLPLEYDGKKKDLVRSKTGKRMVDLKGLTLELKFLDIDLKRLLKEGARVKVMTNKKQ